MIQCAVKGVSIKDIKLAPTYGTDRYDQLTGWSITLADLAGSLEDNQLDPDRFAGLADEFVWEESLHLSQKLSWAEEYAAEVARLRIAGTTVERLAEQFGKSVPTIRSALRRAAGLEEFAGRLSGKLPRARWHEDKENVREVVALTAQGLSVPVIARRVGKSEPTIRKALEFATRLAPSEIPASESGTKQDTGTDSDAA
jgi:DNA-binding CsgD family transcriptional regulator